MSVPLARNDVCDAAVAQQFVEGFEVATENFIEAAAMRCELLTKHSCYFALLGRWLEVAAGDAVREIIDFTDQLRGPTDGVLTLPGQSALD